MTNKEDLEKVLASLVSRKSRQIFFEKAINNGRLRWEDVPDKYVDDVLEMPPSNAMIAVNGGEFKEDPKKITQLVFRAKLAEHSERYDIAASLYKELDNIPKAVECARKRGLNGIAESWADEYINAEYDEKSKLFSYSPNPQVEFSANRAKHLGLEERAKQIVLDYLDTQAEAEINKQTAKAKPILCEKLAKMAQEYDLQEKTEAFYTRAMQFHEENGDYDAALRVARTLLDPEKIELYDNLRYLVADYKRRKQIEQDRADDEDGKEFERPK